MNILYTSSSYYPHINGVYYFVCRIGPLLQEKGHKIAVIAPSESVHFSLKKIDDLDVYGIPSYPIIVNPTTRLPIPLFLKSRLRRIIEDFKPDIIHVQDHFPLSKAVVALNRKLKIPIIGSNHFMPENFTIVLRTETGARLIRPHLRVDVIAISSGIRMQIFNPSGDTREIKKKYSIPDKPILLYVGRLDPEKHMEEILHAVAIAIKNVDFCFVIVGKGTSKIALEKLTQQLEITNNVIFAGFVPDDDLPYFYKMGRCFIIASIAELLSLGALQAMASGLPVIAVNAGALSELVRDKVNGLFEEGDI